MTGSGQTIGTADYMAPEQTSDSHSADIRATSTASVARSSSCFPAMRRLMVRNTAGRSTK